MRIASIEAAAVQEPTLLGRSRLADAAWQAEIDHMNPLGQDPRYAGQTERFRPPWSEVLCVATAEDGTFGVGLSGLAGLTVPMINDYLGPMVTGSNVSDVEEHWAMMTAASRAHFGLSGPATYAISAVDLALWDLRAKLEGLPVWAMLGGSGDSEAVPCYATGMGVAEMGSYGFGAFKLACPWGPDLDRSLDRLNRELVEARRLAGPDQPLMLDCWAIDAVEDAVAVAQVCEPFGLTWIEDVIRPDDWVGYSKLRSQLTDTALAAGERWYTVETFMQSIDEGWVDVVQPDVLWIGGATPTAKIAERAAECGVDLALHCGANDAFGQHLSYGLVNNLWAEMYIGCAPGASLMDSYRATPGMALPERGRIRPTEAPGFGIELSLDQIAAITR